MLWNIFAKCISCKRLKISKESHLPSHSVRYWSIVQWSFRLKLPSSYGPCFGEARLPGDRDVSLHRAKFGRQQKLPGAEYATLPKFKSHATSQRTHGVIITSLSRQSDIATSFWRYNDIIIVACVRHLPMKPVSFIKSFRNFPLSKAVPLSCPVQIFETNEQLRNELWINNIL